jgi:hypothetical protein
MFYLSNAANAILQEAMEEIDPSEFGYRVQILVVEALKLQTGWEKLYDNSGAGQPDCYLDGKYGFEIKCRQTNPMPIDANGWEAMENYQNPRLVAMYSLSAPYPLWVADLSEVPQKPVRLDHDTVVDPRLEDHLKEFLSQLTEAVGIFRLIRGNREEANKFIRHCAESLHSNV